MESSIKNTNNIDTKNIEIKKEEKNINDIENNSKENNIVNNKILKTYTNYKKDKNIFDYKNNINNNNEIKSNVKYISLIPKQINKITDEKNNTKIKKDKKNNFFLLKYEDYKAKMKQFSKSINLTSREKGKNKKLDFDINNHQRKKNSLNKDFISVEKIFKKYNSKEWNTIYIKRFKSYQENFDKKREEMRKLKEKEKKQKEDEIISLSNKKRPKSSTKLLYNKFIIKSRYNNINQISKYNSKFREQRFQMHNTNNKEKLFNNRYIDKDMEKIKNNNIISYKGNIYDLEEERKTLLSMSKRKNLSKITDDNNKNLIKEKYDLKYNNSNKQNIISETDKLIYEFIKRHLE